MTKTCFEFMSFFIRICFGFRISDFGFKLEQGLLAMVYLNFTMNINPYY